jgi:hypothetical protein
VLHETSLLWEDTRFTWAPTSSMGFIRRHASPDEVPQPALLTHHPLEYQDPPPLIDVDG